MIILVDQDDTIADYHGHILAIWRAEHSRKSWKHFAHHVHWRAELNYPEKYHALIHEITMRKNFFRDLPVIPGAKEALEFLLNAGHEVRIVTAPKIEHTPCVPEKYAWVEAHLGEEWVKRLMLTCDKTFVHGNILIDDKPSITGAHHPTWEHVLYDRPFNQTQSNRRLTWTNFKEVLAL
jgi:5'-nucleotidase